jgi:hypothetical protein
VADLLSWGASWLKEMAGTHCSQVVVLTINSLEYEVTASLVDESGRVLPGPVNLVSEHTKFLFSTSELVSKGAVLSRNTIITWGDSQYQLVMQGNKYYTYNDVYKQNIVVAAKHVLDADS